MHYYSRTLLVCVLLLASRFVYADSLNLQVNTSEGTASSSLTTCASTATPTAVCGTSQATGSLSMGTAGALAQILSALPNLSGQTFWAAASSAQLTYVNTVRVPTGPTTMVGLSAGNIIYTLSVDGAETFTGTGGTGGAELLIGPGESFVGSAGSYLFLPTGLSTVQISTPVSGGTSAFSFTLADAVRCPSYTALQVSMGESCTATVDFLDPAMITAASVYDVNGNLIPNATIVSQSGYSPPAATPEPASIFLCSTGLAGLAGTLRRARWRKRLA